MRVGRARYALVEHEGLLVSARRGRGDPTNAEAIEAETQQTHRIEFEGRTFGRVSGSAMQTESGVSCAKQIDLRMHAILPFLSACWKHEAQEMRTMLALPLSPGQPQSYGRGAS